MSRRTLLALPVILAACGLTAETAAPPTAPAATGIALPRVAAPRLVAAADLLVPEAGTVTADLIDRCNAGQDLSNDLVVNALVVSFDHGVAVGAERYFELAADGQVVGGRVDIAPVVEHFDARLRAARELSEACPSWTGDAVYVPRVALMIDGRVPAREVFYHVGALAALDYQEIYTVTALAVPDAGDWASAPAAAPAVVPTDAPAPEHALGVSFRDNAVQLFGSAISELRDEGVTLGCTGRCASAAAVPIQPIAELARQALDIYPDPRPAWVIVDEFVTHEAEIAMTSALLDVGAPRIRHGSIGATLQLHEGELLPLPPAETTPLDLSAAAVYPAFRATVGED